MQGISFKNTLAVNLIVLALCVAAGLFLSVSYPVLVLPWCIVSLIVVAAFNLLAYRKASYIFDLIQDMMDEGTLEQSLALQGVGLGRLAARIKKQSDVIVMDRSNTQPLVPVDLEKNELESVVHCMNDGLIIYDLDLNVILLNPALAQMLIPSNPAATGRLIQNPDDKLLFERCTDVEQMKQIHNAMVEDPTLPRCDEIELSHPTQFLKRYSSPLYNSEHTVIGHVIIYHDTTQQVLSERVRSEFITNASHELRTPVTSIKLLLESLDVGAKEDPKMRDEFIANLLKEADRLHVLVNELLDLSRLESANDSLKLSEVHLAKLVRDSIQTVRPLAQQKGIDIKENISSDLDIIEADPLRLSQVIVNLVNNAVKFTSTGGEVRIIARHLEDNEIQFQVQDTGIGIPQADLPYVFDRFYRVESDRQRRHNSGGSGLGLTITRKVVEMHGGKIKVASQPSKGTTFTFTIPQKKALAQLSA